MEGGKRQGRYENVCGGRVYRSRVCGGMHVVRGCGGVLDGC